MEELEKNLKELMELEESRGFKPSWELHECVNLEKKNAVLREMVLDLLPKRVQRWLSQVEEARTYEGAPIPRFLREVYNSNWEDSYHSFAPTREFEGMVRGKVLKIVLEYSAVKVYLDGEYLTGIPLENLEMEK